MRMTPGQYAAKYRDLDVFLCTEDQANGATGDATPAGGTWEKADIKAYRLNLKTAYQSDVLSIEKFKSTVRPHYGGKFAITVWVKNATSGAVEARTYTDKFALAENMNDPFYGKGSPEECQVVLQLAVRYGLFPREQLQIYCTNGNIGLDCNGFVGNYLRHVVEERSWWTDAHTKAEERTQFDANTSIKGIMGWTGKVAAVTAIGDLELWNQSPFILGMCNERGAILDHVQNPDGSMAYGHIMITEPGTAYIGHNVVKPGLGFNERSVQVEVWESAGGKGLQKSTYTILAANDHGAHLVYRGINDTTMWVRLVRLAV